MHVLVEADGDELAALRKQSLCIRDGDVFLVDVADLELALRQVPNGFKLFDWFLLLLSLFLASTLRLFENKGIVKLGLLCLNLVTYFAWLNSSTLVKQFLFQEIATALGYHLFWIVRLFASRYTSLILSTLILYNCVHLASLAALRRRFDESALARVVFTDNQWLMLLF